MTSEHAAPAAIEPDSKDWTWTIEQACPDCGYDGASVPAEAVAGRLRSTIPKWVAAMSRPDVRERPSSQVWSPLEYACHVRDVASLFGVRVRSMLQIDNPDFANWDQDETAVSERYWAQDPAVVAADYEREASATADLFDSVTGEAWQRTGRRSDGAHFTVATIGVYLIHDIEHHLHDIGA